MKDLTNEMATYILLKVLIKEEDRVASVISAIDQEIAVIPRGALVRTPTGIVKRNRMFEGRFAKVPYPQYYSYIPQLLVCSFMV